MTHVSKRLTTRNLLGLGLVACLALLLATPASAMVLRFGELYTLEKGTVVEDDLYVAGESVSMNGTSTDDVLALGSLISQEGAVQGDAIYGGGQVRVSGPVEGDLRIVGGKITVTGLVEEDTVLVGGIIRVTKDAVILGDLLVVGEHVTLEGYVEGFVDARARTLTVTGQLASDLRSVSTESLTLKGDASIAGDLFYSAPREAFISDTATIAGDIEYTQNSATPTESTVNLVGLIFRILITLIGAFVLAGLFPGFSRTLVNNALREGSGMRILTGLITFFAWPVLAIVAMVTIIGFVPGLVMLLLYGTLLGVASALAAVIAGVLLARWLKHEDEELSLSWVALGTVAYTLLSLLPFVGFLVRALILLLAFWTLCELLYQKLWLSRKSSENSAPAPKNNEQDDTKDNNKADEQTS